MGLQQHTASRSHTSFAGHGETTQRRARCCAAPLSRAAGGVPSHEVAAHCSASSRRAALLLLPLLHACAAAAPSRAEGEASGAAAAPSGAAVHVTALPTPAPFLQPPRTRAAASAAALAASLTLVAGTARAVGRASSRAPPGAPAPATAAAAPALAPPAPLLPHGALATAVAAVASPPRRAAPASPPAARAPEPRPPLPSSPPAALVGALLHPVAALPPLLRLSFGSCSVPHPDKAATGGEDAFAFDASVGCVALADGVGGWAEEGVDPAGYSRGLVAAAVAAVRGGAPPPHHPAPSGSTPSHAIHVAPPRVSPGAALMAAADATRLPGSATAVVLCIDATTGAASAANVGDAGFLHASRSGAALLASSPMVHGFNQPYQLGWLPFAPHSDVASDAELYAFKLRAGESIIVASDGLWDNVELHEVASIAARHHRATSAPRSASGGGIGAGADEDGAAANAAAEELARLAASRGMDETFDSPFAKAARSKGGIRISPWRRLLGEQDMKGGKADDTTVVVVFANDAL